MVEIKELKKSKKGDEVIIRMVKYGKGRKVKILRKVIIIKMVKNKKQYYQKKLNLKKISQ